MIEGEWYTPDKTGMPQSPGDGANDEPATNELPTIVRYDDRTNRWYSERPWVGAKKEFCGTDMEGGVDG